MPIDPALAVKVARERGLTLSDARALMLLADTEDDAQLFADTFASTPPPDPGAEFDDWIRRTPEEDS